MFRKSLKITNNKTTKNTASTSSNSSNNNNNNSSNRPHESYIYSSPASHIIDLDPLTTTQRHSVNVTTITDSKKNDKRSSTSSLDPSTVTNNTKMNIEQKVGSKTQIAPATNSELNSSGDNLDTVGCESTDELDEEIVNNQNEAFTEDEDDDDDEYEEDMNSIAPIVQVKYPCEYDYDGRKFKLVESERLFLISKTNQDWWLCLRIEENLTFFVPASYLKELPTIDGKHQASVKPPPRPPPPPPPSSSQKNSNRFSVDSLELPTTTCSQPPQIKQRSKSEIANEQDEYDASDIISDLDERLNIEERSSFASLSDQTKLNETTASDYDDQHVYQNLPVAPRRERSSTLPERPAQSDSKFSTRLSHIEQTPYQSLADSTSGNNRNSEQQAVIMSNNEEEEENTVLNEEEIRVPKGWLLEPNKYDRKCFLNELTGERWYLNYDAAGKHYFYNANNEAVWDLPVIFAESPDHQPYSLLDTEDNQSGENKFCKIIDDDLSTFKNLYSRLSMRGPKNTDQQQQLAATTASPPHSTSSTSKSYLNTTSTTTTDSTSRISQPRLLTANINYFNKPPSDMSSHFKCILLVKHGKRSRKKLSMNYRVNLASTKLLFVKESKSQEKLELMLDFKGGKCFKVDKSPIRKNSDYNSNSKDSNNNFKEREKERMELVELIGLSKYAFIVETLNGFKVLIISEQEHIVDNWVSSINSIILQFQSEFSPIYEGPELLHSTQQTSNRPGGYIAQQFHSKIMASDNKKTTKKDTTESLLQMRPNRDLRPILYTKNKSYLFNIQVGYMNDENSVATSQPLPPPLPEKLPPPLTFKSSSSSALVVPSSSHVLSPNRLASSSSTFNAILQRLNDFLKRRPTLDSLKKDGIIKECIFGANLINLCRKERRNVPLFVEEIINCIEAKGLDMDGLYRVSGNITEVQKLRYQVDHGKQNFKDFDIHVLSGGLKTFFRELDDSLVPTAFTPHFIEAMSIGDKAEKLSLMHELIKRMPIEHRETLRHLLNHLLKVIALSDQNRMSLKNIAVLFGPNIMRSSAANGGDYNPLMLQNQIAEYMLINFKELFAFPHNAVYEALIN